MDDGWKVELKEWKSRVKELEEKVLVLEKKNSLLEGQLMARDMVEKNHQKELDRLWEMVKNK